MCKKCKSEPWQCKETQKESETNLIVKLYDRNWDFDKLTFGQLSDLKTLLISKLKHIDSKLKDISKSLGNIKE